MEIQISSHEHPLLYEEEGYGKAAVCNGCGKSVSGTIYGCSSCRFYLHEECLQLPEEIQHFFHPCPCPLYLFNPSFTFTCDACFGSYNETFFKCQKCDFSLDIRCALPPKMKSGDDNLIQHYSHGHSLTLLHDSSTESYCEACGKVCGGLAAYSCSRKCNFFVHESCLEIPREIHHFFHSCPIKLSPPRFDFQSRCAACHLISCSRLAYRCSDCDFGMGLRCALMSRTIKSDVHQEMFQPDGQDYLEHFSHGHPLLLLELNDGNGVYCKVCKDVCSGLVYGCSRCNFIVHKSCPDAPREIHHPFHPRHPLTMTLKSSQFCKVCGLFRKDDFWYCCDQCGFCLDLGCARLRPSITYDGHKHLLALIPKMDTSKHCQVCSYPCYENLLHCVACRFIIHLHCHSSLPQTIKHECHIHQLILFRSPPKEDRADASGAFWCHACEDQRNGEDPIYYCGKCRFAAHVKCVLSEILPLLTAKEQMLLRRAIECQSAAMDKEICGGDSTLENLERDMAEIRAMMDPLVAEEEKLEAEMKILATDLQAVKEKIVPLKEKLEALEEEHGWHRMYIAAQARGSRGSN